MKKDYDYPLKIAVMSGAIMNAGDYLIVESAKKLLKHVYPNCEIKEFLRNASIERYLTQINECDVLVFAGGPGFHNEFYPKGMPLVEDLTRITIPFFIMGMGWFGADTRPETVYTYYMGEAMQRFLQRAISDTKMLGCRDWYSVKVLRNVGVESGYMTGCPAWYYDMESINSLKLPEEKRGFSNIKKICISDPANVINFGEMTELAKYCQSNFPEAQVIGVFHRGIGQEHPYILKETQVYQRKLVEELQKLGICCVDISQNGIKGLQIYDDCDIHIGFRVHAHIYNLSRRNRSILIEEDGRGGGVNEALGLERITAYNVGLPLSLTAENCKKRANEFFLYQVEDYLCNLADDGFAQMEHAYMKMNHYYKNMEEHIRSILKYI